MDARSLAVTTALVINLRTAKAFEQIAALELLPPQTALASVHIIVMILLLVAPMALTVVGDLLLHAAPCPRLIGFHLRAPVGCGLWLHAGHGSFPPRAHVAHLRLDGKGWRPLSPDVLDGVPSGASGVVAAAPLR